MSFGNPFGIQDGVLSLGHNGFEVSLSYVAGLPDPAIVSNSTLKLIFKSLLKRDDTTKEKALTELCIFITPENSGLLKDDVVLMTWVQLYPKLAVAESKIVRSLAHQAQTLFIAVLQRSYSKYLKDTVPLLLTGIYDLDTSVSNATLKSISRAFPDTSKVNNLWIIFQSEILNFADQVLNKETVDSLSDDRVVPRDEAELKYLRLVSATTSMISHLIQLGLKVNPTKLDENLEKYQEVFLYENLWHHLLVNTNGNNQRIYKTLLSLMNVVTKLKPELFTQKAWKLASKRLLKSLSFAKKVDPLSPNALPYSSLVLPIIGTLNALNSTNPEFYQYDKAHKERITEFLKLGSLNSNALYYKELAVLLKTSPVFNEEDFAMIESILHTDFQMELKRNSKLRNGTPFIVNSLNTYLDVVTFFHQQASISTVIDEILEIQTSIAKECVSSLAKFVPTDIISQKLEAWVVADTGNITTLVSVALESHVELTSALELALTDLRDKAQVDEEGTSFSQHHCFILYDLIVVNQLTQYRSQFDEFFDELPSYITPLLIDQPISILVHYSKSQLYDESLFIEIFDSFVLRLEMLGLKDKLISQVDKLEHRDVLLEHSTALKMAISEASEGYSFEDDTLFKSHLINGRSSLDLWALAKEQGNEPLFLEFFLRNKNDGLLESLVTNTDLLEKTLWTRDLNSELHTKVQEHFTNPDIKSKYFVLLKRHILKQGSAERVEELVRELLKESPELSSELIKGDLTAEFQAAYGNTIDSRLAIGNPLQSSIYLLPNEAGCFKFESLAGCLRYGSFLAKVGATSDLEYLSLLAEVANDYEFLNNGTHPLIECSILGDMKEHFISVFEDHEYSSLVHQLFTKSCGSLSELITDDNVLGFYYTRIIKSILESMTATKAQVLEMDIDGFVRTSLRAKSPIDQLLFQTVTSTLSPFLSDVRFERSRNLIASEILGLRPSEILSVGVSRLLSLVHFLDIEDVSEDFIPIDPRRLNMIVSELNKWLDSDMAYEPEFNKVRILLIQQLQVLNTFDFAKSEAFNELSLRVLQDATGLVSLGEEGIELKYHTLKFFILLQKRGVLDSSVLKDTENELIDSFVNDKTENVDQPTILYFELLHRVFDKLPVKRFQEHYDALVEKYQTINSTYLKRHLLSILNRLILAKQQDDVIEFELSKDEDLSSFKIPDVLIENIKKAPSYTGEDIDQKMVEYLWHWNIVLLHFKDITLKMRSLYIQQLQVDNDELITKFLNFISLIIVDIDDKDFLIKLEDPQFFIDYEYTNDLDNASEEVKLLSIHIYYTILISIGSLASSWFVVIKDRGFKKQLEQLTSKYISPSLIGSKISLFEGKIDKFTSENENLSIRINRITNEVKATYLIDEQNMEVVFRVPVNYPLSNVDVTGPQRVGVKETQWKAWLLACQRIVSLQNGEISEALEFFLKNVSFHFKGFEECAICYSILHQDSSLPSKSCQTCKNKFHAGCLYKWFKSSGSNTCPLCRANFNFR